MADSLIGDDTFGIKGISGGEKRRVGVGVELVKDPPIIFLDVSALDPGMCVASRCDRRCVSMRSLRITTTSSQRQSTLLL